MKNLLCFFFFIGALSVSGSASGGELINLGMVSQLVEIKYNSEACLSRIIGEATNSKSQKDQAIAGYNEIRVRIDRIIYQLCADLRAGNSVRSYNRLCRYYKGHGMGEAKGTNDAIEPYILAFQDLYLTYRKTVYPEQQGMMIAAAALLPILESGWTLTKEIREMKGKKVDGVIELLNNLRLNSPQEVAKNK